MIMPFVVVVRMLMIMSTMIPLMRVIMTTARGRVIMAVFMLMHMVMLMYMSMLMYMD